jgi:DNA-binding transcriptional ArsR family regulator
LTIRPTGLYVVLNQSVEQGAPVVDDELSRVFAALADPIRRDVVTRLAVGDATVSALADPYDVSIQAVSKHIKVLTDAGLVSQTKDGRRRPCHLEAEVFDLMTKWIERYRQQAQERYERLDALLAEMQGDGAPTAQPHGHPHHQEGAAS